MKVPGLDPLPPSTKRVWRLKKYSKSSSEIEQEQQKYADLEFSPKKSTRRPKSKPGEQQQFVFVDLSPRKKNVQNEPKQEHPTAPDMNSTQIGECQPRKQEDYATKRHSISRLFRLSSPDQPNPQLLESPDLIPQKPTLHQVQTDILSSRGSVISRASSPLTQQVPQLKRTMTPQLVMTVSNGRAVLQPSSASSSTTDLFSLQSHRSPSPKREADSPLAYGDSSSDEAQDACRAFEKAVQRRKRANTGGSTHSITNRGSLSRTHSICSMSSVYRGNPRMSPSRAAMLNMRQTTPAEARPPAMDDFVGFFDDASREPKRPLGHLRHQKSISTLGPALGMDFDGDLTLTKSTNHHPDDLTEFFDFSAFGEEQFHFQDI